MPWTEMRGSKKYWYASEKYKPAKDLRTQLLSMNLPFPENRPPEWSDDHYYYMMLLVQNKSMTPKKTGMKQGHARRAIDANIVPAAHYKATVKLAEPDFIESTVTGTSKVSFEKAVEAAVAKIDAGVKLMDNRAPVIDHGVQVKDGVITSYRATLRVEAASKR